MLKKIFNCHLIFSCLLCLFGGMMDGFSLLYKNDVFCLIQTGNLVKSIINFVNGNYEMGIFTLSLYVCFACSIFLFSIIFSSLKNKHYNTKILSLILIAFLLLPLIFIESSSKILSFLNFFSSLPLAVIGAILLESFKEENYIFYSPTMMTANTRSLMEDVVLFFKNHNVEKGIHAISYVFLILSFCIGILSIALLHRYVTSFSYNYCLILIYSVLFFVLIVSFVINKKVSFKYYE